MHLWVFLCEIVNFDTDLTSYTRNDHKWSNKNTCLNQIQCDAVHILYSSHNNKQNKSKCMYVEWSRRLNRWQQMPACDHKSCITICIITWQNSACIRSSCRATPLQTPPTPHVCVLIYTQVKHIHSFGSVINAKVWEIAFFSVYDCMDSFIYSWGENVVHPTLIHLSVSKLQSVQNINKVLFQRVDFDR